MFAPKIKRRRDVREIRLINHTLFQLTTLLYSHTSLLKKS